MSATVTVTPGMFQASDGAVYRVVLSRAGRPYAKRLNERGGFDYSPAAIFKLTEDDRMTLAQAQAFGRRFGVCAYCGRTLTDPASIAAGIGPVCAKGEDGRWSSEERAAAKAQLNWDEIEAEKRDAREALAAASVAAAPEPVVPAEPAGTLTVEGSTATLVAPYDPDSVAACRAIPGRRWDAARKVNTFSTTNVEAVAALRALVERFGYEVEGELPDVTEALAQREANADASAATDAEVEVTGLGGELLPFQKAGVAYAIANGSVLIGDEMGLGKTVEALAAIQAADAYPALVVVPAVVKLNWQRETRRWLPGRRVAVLSGRKADAAEIAGADVVIVNYDIVGAWADVLKARGFAAIVCDESHYLKNGKAQRTKAVRGLARKIALRLLLTGTPVLNRPVELIAQLDVLGRLDEFGGFWNFAKRYCAAVDTGYGWDMTGASHLDELHEKLRRVCYVRRTKDQVLTELPAKRRATVPMDVDREAYRRVEADMRAFIADKVAGDSDFQALIADLDPDDAAAAEAVEIERRARRSGQAEVLAQINALRQTVARLKLDSVKAWVADFLESGQKLVLFAHHQEIVDALAAEFGAERIRGGDSGEARQAAVDRFQTDPEARIIVCSIGAGGVGLTLTAASDVAFAELPWRPGDLDQAEDRCHRIGQHDSVTAWYLLAEDTIDTDMGALLDEKRGVVEATTDGREAASSSIMADLVAAIARRGEEG